MNCSKKKKVNKEAEEEVVFTGVEDDGYGVQILGGVHRTSPEGLNLVELTRDCNFKLRLRNGNDHSSMVDVSVDTVIVGRFLLQSYIEFDIERPIDRPLNFTYTPTGGASPEKAKKEKERCNSIPCAEGTIVCSFAPEEGSKTIQLEIKDHHTNTIQRVEMLNDSKVSDLYTELESDLGTWVSEPGYMLIGWTSAEYDSPVDDILSPYMQTCLGSYRRKNEPTCRMSLIHINKVEVTLPEDDSKVTLTFDSFPTLGGVISGLREDGKHLPEEWYLLSADDRFLCSSSWAQDRMAIPHLLHKDEVLRDPSAIHLKLLSEPPSGMFVIYTRLMSGQLFQLQVCPDTTIRECQYQLEFRGGPWGRGPRWLYGGTLLDDKYVIGHYGIEAKNTLDVVLRIQESGEKQPVHVGQPVAVEFTTCSAALLFQDSIQGSRPKEKAKDKTGRKIVHRRTTTLRGRSVQQFVEVDPIRVDERFRRDIHMTLVPKGESPDIPQPHNNQHRKKSGCVLQ